jgi:mannose-binding lectin 2
VRLPSVAYLGFSAETGELSDNHDIISVITKSLYEPNVPGKEEGRPGHGGDTKAQGKKGKTYDPNRGESRGWGWTFIKLVLVIVGIIGTYVAYTAWRAQLRRSRF